MSDVSSAPQLETVKRKTIIIADDDFFMRTQAKIALESLADIIEVESGAMVLELYKQHKPELLLLDIHMPDQGGKDVLREILKHDPNAYVIMFSSDAQTQNVQQAKFAGAKGFVAKPFTKNNLLKYVKICPAFRD